MQFSEGSGPVTSDLFAPGSPDVPGQDRIERERQFHDDFACTLNPIEMPPEPLPDLDQAILAGIGPLDGKRVLDLGCGAGDLTLALVERGAQVTAVDLSPGMIAVARQRAELYCESVASVDFQTAAIEALPFENNSFDFAIGRFVLHHLDLSLAPQQIARVLVAGGSAVFAENSANNPLLMWSREHLAGRYGIPRYGTVDEKPLGPDGIRQLRDAFSTVNLEYPEFEFFVVFDRQILRFRSKVLSRVCRALDRGVWHLPPARRFSFRVVVRGIA